MRYVIGLSLCVFCAVFLSACAKNIESDSAQMIQEEYETTVEMTILAEPVDQQLDIILAEIHEEIFPGTAGSSLTAVPHCISLLNWCETTAMMDDEILYLVLTYMYDLPNEEYDLFQSQMETLFHVQRELSAGNAKELLDSIGISEELSWSAMAVQHFNSIMDAAGVDVYNYPFIHQ